MWAHHRHMLCKLFDSNGKPRNTSAHMCEKYNRLALQPESPALPVCDHLGLHFVHSILYYSVFALVKTAIVGWHHHLKVNMSLLESWTLSFLNK